MSYRRGFTLIELLVVIAIIGIFSTIVMTFLSDSRSKGRDAQLVSEVKQLQHALDLYYAQYDRYPLSTNCGATIPNNSWCNSIESMNVAGTHWIRHNGTQDVLAQYIGQEPNNAEVGATAEWNTSPQSPYSGRGIYYFSTGYGAPGQWYMLVFALENPNALDSTDGLYPPNKAQFFDYGSSNTDGVITIGRTTVN